MSVVRDLHSVTSKRMPVLYGAGALAAVLVGMVIAYQFFLTIPLRIDGKSVRLQAGVLVSNLSAEKRVAGRPGDLVAASSHKVLKRGEGQPPYVHVNGHRADASDRLYASDDVRGMDGSDTVEAIETRTEPIPASVRYIGSGPLETVVSNSVPGVREVSFGSISREVVARRTAKKPVAQVVRRSAPYRGAKVVALTFDDGPWPGQTEAILKILQANGIKATFFEIGRQAARHPDLARRLASAGMAMGNHSQTHPNLTHLSGAGITWQIASAEVAITRASGQRPRYFRPPGGNANGALHAELAKEGLRFVQWDIDTEDWRRPPASVIVSTVLRQVEPGSVILMHDGGGDRSHTIQALPIIIQRLKALGYGFVTLDGIARLPQRMG